MSYLLEVMLRKSLEIYTQNSFEELTSRHEGQYLVMS